MEQTLLPMDDLAPVAELDGRDELNLAEFPLFSLQRRIPRDQKTLRFETENVNRRNGKLHKRTFQITGADAYGLPTARDSDVLMALLYYAKEQNKLQSQTVHFSRREMAKILGWDSSGTSYRTIRDALFKWLGVTLEYQKSFWHAGDEKWKTIGFHVLEKVELEDETGKARQSSLLFRDEDVQEGYASSVRFSDEFFDSLKNGYVKKLNLADFFSLSIPAAKQIYRFLDKRFYHEKKLEFDLREFGYERIGFSRKYAPTKLKDKLEPALAELEAIGFIVKATREQRYRKETGRGEWSILFERTGRKAITKPLSVGKGERTTARVLVKELSDRGVSPNRAIELVEDKANGEKHIRRMLEYFDWKVAQGESIPRPGGFLAKAIREGQDWSLDKAFKTKAELAELKAAKSEQAKLVAQNKINERQAEEASRRQEAEQRDTDWKRIDAYLVKLTDPQRRTVQEEAMAGVSETMLKFVKDHLNNPTVRRGFGAEAWKTALLEVIDKRGI